MDDLLSNLKKEVTKASDNKDFIHHQWFVKYHLEILEQIALELCTIYPNANRDLVFAMVWVHDYGKILDYHNQYEETQKKGKGMLLALGFEDTFSQQIIDYIKILDNNMNEDLHQAPLEVQIVSSADAASHFVGPFFDLWWYENANKPFQELMAGSLEKLNKDWERKIVLPEVQKAFTARHDHFLELWGVLPDKYLTNN